MTKDGSRYARLIEAVFLKNYEDGSREVVFQREDLAQAARELAIDLPKNLGDVIYSFRYRESLPETVRKQAPAGLEWVIRPAGAGKYAFSLTDLSRIRPNELLAETSIPDATPGIIVQHGLCDEQGLLARIRYNRLLDIFTGVACYSLQNHLRTSVADLGQVETDEIYVGIDKHGRQYVFPVQAKSGSDRLSVVQIEQDFALCAEKFSQLTCRPIAAQFMADDLVALFSFEEGARGVAILDEKHYRLVASGPEEES